MEKNPFSGLKIASSEFLDQVCGRSKCPQCGKSRKHFCHVCCVPMADVSGKLPLVQLPVKVDIIKHPAELTGKSTSSHAVILAPSQVTIHLYPHIPDYDPAKVVLVFPGEGALTFEQYAEQCCPLVSDAVDQPPEPLAADAASRKRRHSASDRQMEPRACRKRAQSAAFERVVFIDSTWHQVHRMSHDERLKDLTRIELTSRNTRFWRHQAGKPSHYLATIEAVYYFMCDLQTTFSQTPYDGRYDNLLFFFSYMYDKIRCEYEKGKTLKAYTPQSS